MPTLNSIKATKTPANAKNNPPSSENSGPFVSDGSESCKERRESCALPLGFESGAYSETLPVTAHK